MMNGKLFLNPPRVVVFALLSLSIAAFASIPLFSHGAPPSETKQPSSEIREIAHYKQWQRVNPKPLYLEASLDALCRMPTPEETVQTSSNPHRRKFFTVYVNNRGKKAMRAKGVPQFPTGAVIVKEKLRTKDSRAPELLTVMIKRAKGFDSSGGDWEYLVVNGSSGKAEGRGKLEHCRNCHALKSKTDFVFRNYLPQKTRHVAETYAGAIKAGSEGRLRRQPSVGRKNLRCRVRP